MSRSRWMYGALAALVLNGCGFDTQPAKENANRSADNAPAAPRSTLFPASSDPSPRSDALAHGNLPFVESYQTGSTESLASGKPMLVFFSAQWCKYCHQMADDAFKNPEVVDLANRFVCVLIDADAEPELCRKFRVQGYPTVQFLSPRGTPLNRLVGKKGTAQVVMAMQAALQNVAQKTGSGDTKTR